MSVESAVAAAPKAVEQTASGLVGLVKKHPGGALVVFSLLILVVIRYRNQLVSLFGRTPGVGTRLAGFAAGPQTTAGA